nr:glycosyltransferase family 39 protein [uncultured Chryseobacterium sp.]
MNKILPISQREILFIYIGFFIVYLSGLFIPLMENDSAQHATMAMRMALNNDFFNIYKGDSPYLDKPHLHFWLAALSMKIFGINQIAYRIPALIALALGAFSTKKLTDILYNKENIGYFASLIFLSAQTIILSAHDVRTDAVLTGLIIFSIWQLVGFIKAGKSSNALLAGLGTALAFSSKGLMAVVIIGCCILAYLLYSREWKKFFNLKIILAAFSFSVGILPVLYAYHHQFGEEGIRFILFNQSMNRLTASGFEETSPDYLFFFHTLLWTFLPFSLGFYFGIVQKTVFFIKNRFSKIQGVEFLTLGGFWMVMLIFSLSKFKLPHYLNGLIAVLSVFCAAYLFDLYRNKLYKTLKILYVIQLVLVFASPLAVGLLTYFFTGIYNMFFYTLYCFLFIFLLSTVFRKQDLFRKYILVSFIFSISINIFLNTQFYPVLTQYQASLKMAEFVNKNKLNKQNVYMLTDYEAWNFDFYTRRNTPRIDEDKLKPGAFLIIYDEHLGKLKHQFKKLHSEDNFRITKLSLKFLNPKTRSAQTDKLSLIQIED